MDEKTGKDLRRERDFLQETLIRVCADRDYWRQMYQNTAEALRLTQDRLVAELDR